MKRLWQRVLAALLSAMFSVAPLGFECSAATSALHPALWRVKGKHGTAYLFGSIHVLPPDIDWRTSAVSEAIGRSDVLVFEIPNDPATQARIAELVSAKGLLPPGTSLPAMLSPEARSDYAADLALARIPSSSLDGKRPWLADLILVVRRMEQEDASFGNGVDATLMREAAGAHKEVRYLESIDTQIALLVPNDPKLELEEFEADLKEFHNENDEFAALVSAWSMGRIRAIDALINGEFASHPEARKALLDDRNRVWALKIERWLDENRTFFVTVGAGHLAGRNSLARLLRSDGYRVDGP
jgi:uncharacterized protein YbaP (TraB family)